ncbi:N-acyl-D-amino-acid deacylase family protein [Hyphobacterium marinum]|uniref:Amidohydrolase family protein n=1 Tax=Hyphobacterium marinum TaxID=3116574 RepID=A0ABU7M027_9PROT|nr:amidohydrolase family protein [Hyphobacterium sp. Y6023]MEE2566770.1 amidohydrolase family protein [Hyphobacterium sp. Y6023]
MAYDIKITGGTVFDGNGGDGIRADIGIRDGRIVALGDCPEDASRTLDASGCIVTPGFIDLHSHYDGQATWDDRMEPSVCHGVTTTVMGNCGVGFAPVKSTDHERLIKLMEGVEDIPGTALAEGLKWNWESFPDYMDALDAQNRTIDVAVHIGHDPLRVYVMGDRAIAEEDATEDDIATMRDLVRAAVEAGAIGFSTGRSDVHKTADGDFTPSSEATARELTGIASAFEGLDHGVVQAVSDFDLEREGDRFEAEWKVLEQYAKAAGGRPFSVSLMQRDFAPDQWLRILEKTEAIRSEGVDMRVQTAPRGIGVFLGLQCTFHFFMGYPSYKEIAHLPFEERVAIMKTPEFKAKILSEKTDKLSGPGSSVPPLADLLMEHIDFVATKLFRLGDNPDYEQPPENSLAAQAEAEGMPLMEKLYDTVLMRDGKELIYFPIYNYTEGSYDNVFKMMTHPAALQGLGDGGAHVGTICDASLPTYLMSYWTRDRKRGERIALPRAVQMLTADIADFLSLTDRGRIAVGQKADLNIIDHDRLNVLPPYMVSDLPAGGRRLLQKAKGYRATLVSGVPVVENDEVTDARPGRLVRAGQ